MAVPWRISTGSGENRFSSIWTARSSGASSLPRRFLIDICQAEAPLTYTSLEGSEIASRASPESTSGRASHQRSVCASKSRRMATTTITCRRRLHPRMLGDILPKARRNHPTSARVAPCTGPARLRFALVRRKTGNGPTGTADYDLFICLNFAEKFGKPGLYFVRVGDHGEWTELV